jgi:hypothetical protein
MKAQEIRDTFTFGPADLATPEEIARYMGAIFTEIAAQLAEHNQLTRESIQLAFPVSAMR